MYLQFIKCKSGGEKKEKKKKMYRWSSGEFRQEKFVAIKQPVMM